MKINSAPARLERTCCVPQGSAATEIGVVRLSFQLAVLDGTELKYLLVRHFLYFKVIWAAATVIKFSRSTVLEYMRTIIRLYELSYSYGSKNVIRIKFSNRTKFNTAATRHC